VFLGICSERFPRGRACGASYARASATVVNAQPTYATFLIAVTFAPVRIASR